jgi:hypothetical protein
VDYISGNGCYVILDLHNFSIGEMVAEIHSMPDMKSIGFWESVAARYANDSAVLFGLYNEPHDVSWSVWKFGGWVTPQKSGETTYRSPGMQGLLNVVRSTGARNIVIAGGLDWGYDLRGVPEYALDDPCGKVMYDTHIYPWKGNERDWDEHIGHVIGKYPVLVGEVGCEPDEAFDPHKWSDEVLCYISKYELNWTAWCFHPSAGPCILEDWTYKPTPYWGDFVKRALGDVFHTGDALPSWDVNEDGRMDVLDLVLVCRHFGAIMKTDLYPNPDVNGDGSIDLLDVALVSEHFGETYSLAVQYQ